MSNDTVIGSLKQKIDELNQQAWEARVNDSPKAFKLSQESVELARSVNYSKGLAEGLRSLGFGYIRLFKNDEAAPLLRESLALFESLNDSKGQAIVYEYLGIIERNWGNLGRSLELLLKGNDLVRQADDLGEIEITSCYQIGVTYKHLGNHENALDYLYRALSLAKKTGFTLMESYAINIIGSIYFDNGDYTQALDCYQRGLVIRRESHDKWGEAGSLDNIGFTYLKLNELDKAIDYCKQSLAISQDNSDKKGEANALLHLAEIYGKAGDIKQASKFSNESLEIRKARGDKRGEAEVLLFLADLHKKKGDIEDQQIFGWISGALQIADEIKAQDLLSKAYYNLHEYHGQKGNYKESLSLLEAHLKIEKELHKNTINQKVTNLEISHKAEAISQRNKELTELNEQIEKANAELRIESSLERVRSAAMAMNRPDDMLDVCTIISHELASLNVKEIRNVQTAIFYEEKGSYMNYEYYARHHKVFITEVEYTNHPIAKKFADQMIKGPNQVWAHGFKGDEVKDWLNYQRTTNVFIDTYLETADSLNYYWYSLGPVALGISTYAPLNENEIELFKRFRNVFELAYRRYLDIEKALAQAREAQIEAALERIRARAMAMHSSDELIEVANILREQMGILGQSELETCVVNLYDVETGIIYNWNAFRQPGLTSGPIITSASSFPGNASELTREMVSMYESGKKEFTLSASDSKLMDFFELLVKSDPQVADYTGRYIPEKVFYHFTAFTGGTLLTVSYQPPNENVKSLQRKAASVFDMAYRRYLDLKKAEAQAREAQIEVSLERVRSRSMAMHKSDELLEVVASVFQQMQLLGFNLNLCNIVLFDSKTLGADYWASGIKQAVLPESYHVPYADHPFYHYQLNTWKNAEPFAVFELTGEIKKSWDEILFTKTDLQKLPDSTKKMMQQLDSVIISSVATKHGLVQAIGSEQLSTDDAAILSRFAKVFEQTYTRFLDLQKAEAQAREAQIEAALERIRSRSMALQKSNELEDVIKVVFEEWKKLGLELYECNINIVNAEENVITLWSYGLGDMATIKGVRLKMFDHPFLNRFMDDFRRQTPYHVSELSGNFLKEYLTKIFTETDFKDAPIEYKQAALSIDHIFICDAYMKYGAMDVVSALPLPDAEAGILIRFAKVFEQTYTRFLDLQKAEAQAKEAQIEASLERVRSRSMAMHKSDELREVVAVLFGQLQQLGFDIKFCTIALIDKINFTAEFWLSGFSQDILPESYHVPNLDHPFYQNFQNTFRQGTSYKVFELAGEEKRSYDKLWFTLTDFKNLPGPVKKPMMDMERVVMSCAFTKNGMIQIGGFEPLSDNDASIIQRFAKVFEQTYTRFVDLQKAEAQAREAQIEAALEKVRSRSLAMHKSDELKDVIHAVFERLNDLNFELDTAIIIIFKEGSNDTVWWLENRKDQQHLGVAVSYTDISYFRNLFEAKKNGKEVISNFYNLEEKNKLLSYLFDHTDFRYTPEPQKEFLLHQECATMSVAIAKNTGIHITRYAKQSFSETQHDILKKFSMVFDQAYTRFLDLQKAEAQAREAQIEAALERVRAKVMAMTNSNDLNETSLVFGEQLRKLDIDWQFSYFWLIEEEKNENTFWITWPDNKTSITIYTLEEAEQYFNECLISWRAGIKIHDNYVPPRDVQAWLDTFQRIADDAGGVARQIMTSQTFGNGVFYYDAMMKYGSFGICINKPATDEEKNIQCRFAIEFERAYTRFLDLKKAEAQTREALIEAALERVRARALAMQQPEELKDVAQVLRSEMGALGVEELETCSIYIHGNSSEDVECWYALQDPKHAEKKMVSDHFVLNLNDTWVGREMKRFYDSGEKQTSIVMQGANRKEWVGYCYKHSPAFTGFYGETIPDRTYHLYKFSHGYIGAAAPGDISNESWKLLARAASVFSLAYSRFKDLTQARIDLIKLKEEKKRAEDALTELQNTQKQLVQTEKMASLGELTAGIAHEIQNPLNFVNNFSDVSNELIEEMKEELAKGNTQQAMIIANDVKDNLDKILHHGKRADGIVKGMLQHSRSSSGIKEPTDINNLADEYLRLAYHGFRAKDKSFSAKFETNFDGKIEKINVVPQDIGRVILNLINNAFYTVNEKKKRVDNGYEPIVTVSTKKMKDKVEISVKDNGNGIPQKVLDKIFQPFFTTKPTGEGTGLGLSLSYDIITKGHAGEINVKTHEGNGSEFVILLPVN